MGYLDSLSHRLLHLRELTRNKNPNNRLSTKTVVHVNVYYESRVQNFLLHCDTDNQQDNMVQNSKLI